MTKSQTRNKGANTRLRISQSAAQLLDERGYFGTGMNDILSRANAPKGSMYFHFPGGKEEVVGVAIQLSGEGISTLLMAALGEADRPEEAVAAIFSYFRQRLHQSSFKCGCPISTTGLELSGTGSPVLNACSEAYSSWMVILKEFLVRFVPDAKAVELTDAIFCLVQGALLMSRITEEISHLDNAEKYCVSLLQDAM